MQLSNLRIGHKLVATLATAIFLLFVIAFVVIAQIGSRNADETASSFAATINTQVVNVVEVYAKELEQSIDRIQGALSLGLPDRFRIDEGASARNGERNLPVLQNGTRPVSLESGFIDRLSQQTKSVVTVFVRDGKDFVRVATSLKKEDGSRVVGTALDQQHPAYSRLTSGESFRGVTRLFGRDYFSKYVPLKDGGKIIGALFIGVDFTEALGGLRERIKSIKVGDTGYAFVINTNKADADFGYFVIHPSMAGKNALDVADADGRVVFKEMLEKKQGEVRYRWKQPGASTATQSIAVVASIPEFEWLVATRADVSELSKSVAAIEWIIFTVGIVMLMVLSALIHFVVQRIVTQPLVSLQDYCSEIERTNDFTRLPPAHGQDEVGKTTESVARLLQNLRRTFGLLLGSIERVDEASRSLAKTARDEANNSGQASDSASAMAASVEELSVGINQISDSANEAAALSRDAGARSQEGGTTILDATREMNAIADKVRDTSTAITALGEESRQISGIVSVIKEVAEQTNLLALNAAIEAARAGEAGRGFAVVADEVRKLAERTTQATTQIAGVTGSIQQRADQAVRAMSEAVDQVERGAALATDAGQAINEIRSGSERVVEVVRMITDALAESGAASENMANQTERVARVAEENNHASQTTLHAAENLERLTGEMRSTVSRFRI